MTIFGEYARRELTANSSEKGKQKMKWDDFPNEPKFHDLKNFLTLFK